MDRRIPELMRQNSEQNLGNCIQDSDHFPVSRQA